MPRNESEQLQPSKLQSALMARIVGLMRSRRMEAGDRLTEFGLAREFRVSRTPVRVALAQLTRQGILEAQPRRGFVLRESAAAIPEIAAPDTGEEEKRLFLAVARDRVSGALPDHVSEADLLRRYHVPRPLLVRALAQMVEIGLVERNSGYGWHFLPAINTAKAHAESYRFRILIEPAALLEPDFALDPAWAHRIRERHQAVLNAPWERTASIGFYEMNAEFHDQLAASSGNRFLHTAVQQQNRLRRFINYDWQYSEDRAFATCREHIAILDRLEEGDREMAALLMKRHLMGASAGVPSFRP